MIDLESFRPEIREKIQNDIEKYGEWATAHCLFLAPLARMLSELKSTDSDFVWLSVVIHTINFYSSKDPGPIHFSAARGVLEKNQISSHEAIDLLSREIVIFCQKLQRHMSSALLNNIEGIRLPTLEDENGFLLPARDSLAGVVFKKEGGNMADFLFTEFIEAIGKKTGCDAATAIRQDSKIRYQAYEASGYQSELRSKNWALWIDGGSPPSIFSPILSILAEVIWRDICIPKWKRLIENVPALTRGIHPAVMRFLSPKIQVENLGQQLEILHEGHMIAMLPTIDRKLIPLVTRGVSHLNSIYHHKLLRYECRLGFENWARGKLDARVLRFERGCTEIAEALGLSSNQAIEGIKAILAAQAYMEFKFDDKSSGNLIVLNHFRSRGCNRDDGIEIILGTQLLPHYTFQASKHSRLLIPLPELPPFVSASKYHASQALLQMMVMEEFMDQSIEFAESGCILITDEKWREFASEAGLPSTVFKEVISRWIQDGDDAPRFLTCVEQARYSLGVAFGKEAEFLRNQGELRKQRQKQGERSAIARKKKRK